MSLLLLGAGVTGADEPVPGPDTLANAVAWWDADQGRYDAAVAGSPVTADGAAIKRWTDRIGGYEATEYPTTNGPRYDATKGAVASCVGPDGPDQFLYLAAGPTINRRNFYLFVICELTTLRKGTDGVSAQTEHYFTSGDVGGFQCGYQGDGSAGTTYGKLSVLNHPEGFKTTSLIPPAGNRVLLGWVGTAGALTTYVNGTSATAAALSSGSEALNAILGSINQAPHRSCQATVLDVILGTALGASELADVILPYAQSRGVTTTFAKQVIFVGDSITQGYGAILNRGWVQDLSLAASVRLTNVSQSGITLAALQAQQAQDFALLVPGEVNVVLMWPGTNDIQGGATGAATYAALKTYSDDWRTAAVAAGATLKIVWVTPLPRGAGAIGGEFAAYRTAMLGDHSKADGIADPIGDATLAAAWGDGTYDYDDVHPNAAGYALVAPILRTAIETAPVNTVLPAITGTTEVGSTLTASTGTWTGLPTYTYQWKRDGVLIALATASTYLLVSADADTTLTVVVTATNAAGSTSATSTGVGPINVPAPGNTVIPVISGTPEVGETLSTNDGTWTGTPTSYAYQWNRDGSPIGGATTSTYVLVLADEGTDVSVVVTATNAGGSTAAESDPVTIDSGGDTNILLTGLVSYYTMDEASGTRADSMATNDLTAVGSVGSAAGKLNSAASWAGSNILTKAIPAGLDNNSFSWSWWLYFDSRSNFDSPAVYANGGWSTGYGWYYDSGSGGVRFWVQAYNGNYVTSGAISTGTWYHCVGVFDDDTDTITLYVNGSSVATLGSMSAPTYTGAALMFNANNFNGRADECGIWSRALSGAEVTALYAGGSVLPFSSFQ